MYCFLQYRKTQIRREVKHSLLASMPKKDLVLLSFKKDEPGLRWEHDREFEYRGQMYDVVAKEERADSVAYWCWPDDKETRLNKYLNDLTEQRLGNDPGKNEQQKRIVSFFKMLYYEPPTAFGIQTKKSEVEQHSRYASGTSIFYLIPPLPPPQTGLKSLV
jgi:hypothetical protein